MRTSVVLVAVALAGCNRAPDISSIDELLRAATPITWAGTLAWAAATGEAGPCVVADGAAGLILSPDDTCPPAFGLAPSGQAAVTLLKSSSDDLVFAAAFGDLRLDDRDPALTDLGAAVVTAHEGDLLVTWADTDVAVEGVSADVVQGTWVVRVDLAGTPGDVADDAWTLQGARQWVSVGTLGSVVVESGLALAETSPDCRLNPVSGGGAVEVVEGNRSNANVDFGTLLFHRTCDGLATFVGAGTSGVAAGEEVDLQAGAEGYTGPG